MSNYQNQKSDGHERMSFKINKIEYLDSNNKIIPELLDRDASNIASELDKISTHQVRRFFDEVKRYQSDIEKRKKPYNEVKPYILMLKSKAKYAASKKPEMKIFYEFIDGSIKKIKDPDQQIEQKKFSAFCLFFEAVYGFADLKK